MEFTKYITGLGIKLTSSEIEGIIKVIQSLEKIGISSKGTNVYKSYKLNGRILWSINESWFTINENCIYTIS